jgi:hypothetical protein
MRTACYVLYAFTAPIAAWGADKIGGPDCGFAVGFGFLLAGLLFGLIKLADD